MLTAVILGNGPSLKNYKFFSKKKYIEIGTNHIFFNKIFNLKRKNIFFTAYDKRFLNNKNNSLWIKYLKKFKGLSYFPPEWENKLSINDTKIKYKFPKNNKKIVSLYLKKFSSPIDLKSSVVTEMAIPLAISLKARRILLIGCEFNYNLTKDRLAKDSYFYDKELNKNFEHNLKTSKNWQKIQIKKLKQISVFLMNYGIVLKDLSIYGKLGFLKYN